MQNNPKLTIAIPTYKRHDEINTLLRSLSEQTNKEFILVISNNSNENKDIDMLKINCSKFKNKFLNIKIINQNKNIGAINNFLYLLNICKTEYFMWLADDDRISINFIETLMPEIEKNEEAVSIVSYWGCVDNEKQTKLIKPKIFDQKLTLIRAISFFYHADDAFFYGIHRTNFLKECTYKKFWPPNHNNILRWCYPYIFQMVLRGKVIGISNKNAVWYNSMDTSKHYFQPKAGSQNKYYTYFTWAIKRINIYFSYLREIIKKKYFFLLIIFLIMLPLVLLRDFIFDFLLDILKPKFKKIFNFS